MTLWKPLRMIELDAVALKDDGQLEVWPAGTGFSVRHIKDGRIDDRIFTSVEACWAEILRRQPSKVA